MCHLPKSTHHFSYCLRHTAFLTHSLAVLLAPHPPRPPISRSAPVSTGQHRGASRLVRAAAVVCQQGGRSEGRGHGTDGAEGAAALAHEDAHQDPDPGDGQVNPGSREE